METNSAQIESASHFLSEAPVGLRRKKNQKRVSIKRQDKSQVHNTNITATHCEFHMLAGRQRDLQQASEALL
jgi:hypothetical protein